MTLHVALLDWSPVYGRQMGTHCLFCMSNRDVLSYSACAGAAAVDAVRSLLKRRSSDSGQVDLLRTSPAPAMQSRSGSRCEEAASGGRRELSGRITGNVKVSLSRRLHEEGLRGRRSDGREQEEPGLPHCRGESPSLSATRPQDGFANERAVDRELVAEGEHSRCRGAVLAARGAWAFAVSPENCSRNMERSALGWAEN
jgi:hypothetical protein